MPIETKTIIADSFLLLARKKGADKVTVKDISEACGISRQAFYYHFQDIPDLIQWIFEKRLQNTMQQALATDDPHQSLVLMINTFSQNTPLLKELQRSQYYDQLQKTFFRDLQDCIRYLIQNRRPDLTLNPRDAETALVFFTCGITGVLLNYVDNKDMDANALADRLLSIFNAKNRMP